MSAIHVPGRADIEELRSQFNKAAFDFPDVDAVVVKLPDLRNEETVRQARECLGPLMHARLVKPGEPESFTVREVIESANCLNEANRWAVQLDTWIPPVHQSIEQQGGQVYYLHTDRELIQQTSGKSAFRHLWHCAVFGPPVRSYDNRAHRLFLMLAADAAGQILNGNGKGDTPRSGWLIHLADRDVPLEVSSRRQFLGWSMFDGKPTWIPATPFNSPPDWWAVRLRHVFLLSRIAIDQVIRKAVANVVNTMAPEEQEESVLRPHWDGATRQLCLGDKSVRTYPRRAPSQFMVLEAFQAAGWPLSIATPQNLKGVKDTVEALNDSLVSSRLRFQRGTGDKTIHWSITPV